MNRDRRPWLAAAVLLLLGAAAGAAEVRLHWLPCRGSMLSGSVLHGYAYGPDFSDACLRAMDDGFAIVWPGGAVRWGAESLLGAGCALLLAVAWTVVVTSSPWSRRTRQLAALPAIAAAASGTASLLRGDNGFELAYTWLLVGVDAFALLAFVAIGMREEPGRRVMLQTGLALAALGTVGFFPLLGDFLVMTYTSDANWDSPPGAGYPTIALLAGLAVALLVVTLRPGRAPLPQAARSSASAAVSALP